MKDPTVSNTSIPISNEDNRSFLLTLLSFHPDKKVDVTTPLAVSHVEGHPTLLVDNDPTSLRKCLVQLQKAYLDKLQTYAKEFF